MDLPNLDSSIQGLSYDPMFNLGMGLLQASGPSLMPHSFGQSLAAGGEYAQQAQQRAMQAQMLKYQAQQMGMYNALIARGAAGALGGQSNMPQINAPSTDAGAAPVLASANGTPGQSFAVPGQSAPAQNGGLTQDPMFWAGMIKDPTAAMGAYFNRAYPQPTDFVKNLEAMGINSQSPQGRALIAQYVQKQNYITPASIRPGGGIQDPITGHITTIPAAAPGGYQNIQGPDGQWQTVQVAGGPEAVAGAAAAKTGGEGSQLPYAGVDANGNPLPVTNRTAAATQGGTPIQSNNPGAVSPGGALAKYPDMKTGLQAIDDNLSSYGKDGINTLEGVITRWAPPKDANGKVINNTPAYIQDASTRLGISPTQPIDLSNPAQRHAIATAIMLHESGPSGVFGQSKGGVYAAAPMGAPQAAVTSKTAPPESMQKDFEAMQAQSPQAQQSLDALDKMIGLAKNKPFYLSGALGAVPGVDRWSADAAEYEKQRANVIALMGKSLGSGGTDASRANIAESIPDYGKPQRAMLDGLQTQRNQVATGMMRKQFLTDAYNASDANKYTQQSNGFDQNIKPSMAPILQLSGAEQAKAIAQAIKDNPGLKSNYKWAYDNGFVK